MPTIFSREQLERAVMPQDVGQLRELNSHQLLRKETGEQIASFEQVVSLGEILLRQQYGSRPLTSREALPSFVKEMGRTGDTFLGKVAFPEGQYPVTAEVIETNTGSELKLHIVPVHLAAFENRQFSSRSDALVALAAAAVVAPQFLSALKDGLQQEECENPNLSVVQPEHGTPLAAIVESFQPEGHNNQTLEGVKQVIKKPLPTLQNVAHIHGQKSYSSQRILSPAGKSGLAGGLPVHTFMRPKLPPHALFLPIKTDLEGKTTVATLQDSLRSAGLQGIDAAFIAAALGMTSLVVGDSKREKVIDRVFSSDKDEPLEYVLLRSQ